MSSSASSSASGLHSILRHRHTSAPLQAQQLAQEPHSASEMGAALASSEDAPPAYDPPRAVPLVAHAKPALTPAPAYPPLKVEAKRLTEPTLASAEELKNCGITAATHGIAATLGAGLLTRSASTSGLAGLIGVFVGIALWGVKVVAAWKQTTIEKNAFAAVKSAMAGLHDRSLEVLQAKMLNCAEDAGTYQQIAMKSLCAEEIRLMANRLQMVEAAVVALIEKPEMLEPTDSEKVRSALVAITDLVPVTGVSDAVKESLGLWQAIVAELSHLVRTWASYQNTFDSVDPDVVHEARTKIIDACNTVRAIPSLPPLTASAVTHLRECAQIFYEIAQLRAEVEKHAAVPVTQRDIMEGQWVAIDAMRSAAHGALGRLLWQRYATQLAEGKAAWSENLRHSINRTRVSATFNPQTQHAAREASGGKDPPSRTIKELQATHRCDLDATKLATAVLMLRKEKFKKLTVAQLPDEIFPWVHNARIRDPLMACVNDLLGDKPGSVTFGQLYTDLRNQRYA